MYTTIGCVNDVMSLTCTGDRTIVVTKAQWGKYNLNCSECCPPNPAYDCFVDMESNEPALFELLKVQCDGLQSCNLEYVSYVINECEIEYMADYEQVFYDCNPFDTTEATAFSVKLNGTRNLRDNEVVPFDDVISNFGGHYSTDTSAFTCPVQGVYMFSMTINQWDYNFIRGILYRNNNELIQSRADNESSFDSATATVITECNAGDQVFVSAGFGGQYDGSDAGCHFTGNLLQQL